MKANGIMMYYSNEMIAIVNSIAVSLAGLTSLVACQVSCACFSQSFCFFFVKCDAALENKVLRALIRAARVRASGGTSTTAGRGGGEQAKEGRI